MEIREFRPADTEQVERCIAALGDHEHGVDARVLPGAAIGGWYLAYIQDECASQAGRILVAEAGGAVVGFVAVQTRVASEQKDEEPYDYAYISDLAVLEDFRGRGLGRALIAAAEQLAVAAGARWLRIGVLARNDGPRRLYERCGFEERDVLFEKSLSSG